MSSLTVRIKSKYGPKYFGRNSEKHLDFQIWKCGVFVPNSKCYFDSFDNIRNRGTQRNFQMLKTTTSFDKQMIFGIWGKDATFLYYKYLEFPMFFLKLVGKDIRNWFEQFDQWGPLCLKLNSNDGLWSYLSYSQNEVKLSQNKENTKYLRSVAHHDELYKTRTRNTWMVEMKWSDIAENYQFCWNADKM